MIENPTGPRAKSATALSTEVGVSQSHPLAAAVHHDALPLRGEQHRGHEGLSYAPTFVVTVRLDTGDQEIILEGFENDFISHLRRITSFAHGTPLDGKARKSPAKQPARKP